MWILNDCFNALKHLNVNFKGIDVLQDENLRQGIKDFSDWPTIPQLYIKGEFIGVVILLKNYSIVVSCKKISRKINKF